MKIKRASFNFTKGVPVLPSFFLLNYFSELNGAEPTIVGFGRCYKICQFSFLMTLCVTAIHENVNLDKC